MTKSNRSVHKQTDTPTTTKTQHFHQKPTCEKAIIEKSLKEELQIKHNPRWKNREQTAHNPIDYKTKNLPLHREKEREERLDAEEENEGGTANEWRALKTLLLYIIYICASTAVPSLFLIFPWPKQIEPLNHSLQQFLLPPISCDPTSDYQPMQPIQFRLDFQNSY